MGTVTARKNSLDRLSYGRVKWYPGEAGYYEIMAASRPLFVRPGWEPRRSAYEQAWEEDTEFIKRLGWMDEPEGAERPKGEAEPERARQNIQRAARRAANAVRDLALSNDFRWFVTLTLDKDKINRYDVKEITKKLNVWLSNMVQRCGLKYVLVAERHKDGAIHFHGLVNEAPGFAPSGTWNVPGHKKPIKPRSAAQRAAWAARDDCHEVYNWERWPLGFSTGIRLYGEYEAAVRYVCKYIRKQTEGPEGAKVGGRWYYSGGDLRRPDVEYINVNVEWMKENCPGAYYFDVPEAGAIFGIWRGSQQKLDCRLTGKTAGEPGPKGAGGPRETMAKKEAEKGEEDADGILIRQGNGSSSAVAHADEPAYHAGESTHGLARGGCAGAENGTVEAPILD